MWPGWSKSQYGTAGVNLAQLTTTGEVHTGIGDAGIDQLSIDSKNAVSYLDLKVFYLAMFNTRS